MKMKLNVILEPSYEGGYTVYVPSLPGYIREVDNIEDALKTLKKQLNFI